MSKIDKTSKSRRVATSDDLEVSAYLELAEQKLGQTVRSDETDVLRQEAIVVLDYGSQYSRLIARRIREANVYCEIHPHDVTVDRLSHLDIKGFILSGGPGSVYDADAADLESHILDKKVPILGICYGMQLLAHSLGGKVAPTPVREYGHAVLHQDAPGHPLFQNLPNSLPVWMSHGDQVLELPQGFRPMAYTGNSPIAVMGNNAGIIGLQFHPEVVHTPAGKQIISNCCYCWFP